MNKFKVAYDFEGVNKNSNYYLIAQKNIQGLIKELREIAESNDLK